VRRATVTTEGGERVVTSSARLMAARCLPATVGYAKPWRRSNRFQLRSRDEGAALSY
jgi:hypothetical protein